jgi:hypothetical protein
MTRCATKAKAKIAPRFETLASKNGCRGPRSRLKGGRAKTLSRAARKAFQFEESGNVVTNEKDVNAMRCGELV